jgi:integrase
MSIIKNTHKFLNKFFVFALSEGYIIRNPLYGLKLPTVNEDDIDENEGNIETFTDEEINTLVKSIGNDKLKYIVLFAVMTGARMGEILALEKTDIKNGIVKINKSVRTVRVYTDESNYEYERKTTRPKNKSSIREIPLPDVLIKEMKNLNVLVNEERLKLGPAYLDNKLLFPSQTGTYIDDKNLRKSWQRAIAKAGIKYRKFHCLRHTYATRMILNGVSILTVSRLLGHSSIKTTEIYAHTLEDMKIQAVNTLNSMLQ